jgi:Mn-dependent DtxR family transcriptional regulator
VILVVALMITPAATAYLLSDRLDRMIWLSAIIGVVGFWLGFLLATLVGASPGASAVVAMTGIFFVALTFAPRYGLLADWVRRNSSIPQEVMEDVLGAILRAKGKSVPVTDVVRYVANPHGRTRRAITMLARRDLLEIDNDNVRLTDGGRIEANRLVRAHRLWETYLEQTGTPEKELHEKAHVLEHITDQATLDYLDDKLGHPLQDPHGTVIPADPSQLKDNREFILSLLREGNRAEVRRVHPAAQSVALKPGDRITMGAREAGGKLWTLHTSDGRQLELHHEEADAIFVRLESMDE